MSRYSWRFTAGLAFLALLIAVIVFVANWSQFVAWCFAQQVEVHRYLVLYLLKLNNHQYDAGLWLIAGAFLYGILHAAGPGHGKFIVISWLSSGHESQVAARAVPFIGSLLQGITAILFVFILVTGFNLASGDLSTSRWIIEKVSALTVACFGAFMIYQALTHVMFVRGHSSSNNDTHGTCGCHHYGTDHGEDRHWKTRIGVMLTVGSRPCSGAIMILLFANTLGIVSWGIAAVMAMSFGTALSIMGLSLAVRYARQQTLNFVTDAEKIVWLVPGIRGIAGVALILFAIVLFLTVIPISPGGDYITAGC